MNLFFISIIAAAVRQLELFVLCSLIEVLIYVLVITKKWYHVIILLVVIEFFRIKGFILTRLLWTQSFTSLFLFLFVTLMVCEASLGIGLVISLTRRVGDEGVCV